MAKISRSSANVFRDLGFTPEEAENLRIRSALMVVASQLIDERKLTQAKAAVLFGVTQPRVSDLVRGRIERFSVDGLIEMLGRAHIRIEMRAVHTHRRKRARVA
jgi:predicted XRE-type DNA-binding protein